MIQLALFPRPVEPEDVEADVRGDPWADPAGLLFSHLPDAPVGDPAYERFGLGPVVNLPRAVAGCLWACNTFGGVA